jgi:hypothetical protein
MVNNKSEAIEEAIAPFLLLILVGFELISGADVSTTQVAQ